MTTDISDPITVEVLYDAMTDGYAIGLDATAADALHTLLQTVAPEDMGLNPLDFAEVSALVNTLRPLLRKHLHGC